MEKNCTIGIDLGGTKIYFAIIDEKGQIISELRSLTDTTGGENLLESLFSGTQKLLEQAKDLNCDIKAIGIGSPGRIDAKNGIVMDCTPNIASWEGTNIKSSFEERFKLPAFVDNDANVAAYGEYYLRKLAGHDESTIIVLTLGTGLGSGIIYNGSLFRGKGLGSEIGHMLLYPEGRACNCGQKGCFEMYVSGTALETQATQRLARYPDSLLNTINGKISSYNIFEFAKKGDLFSGILIDELAEAFSYALISLINIFDPELILLGGGISRQTDFYMKKVLKIIEDNINYNSFNKNILQVAKSDDKAGLIGAGLIAFYGYNKGEI